MIRGLTLFIDTLIHNLIQIPQKIRKRYERAAKTVLEGVALSRIMFSCHRLLRIGKFPTMKPMEDKASKPAEPKPVKKVDLSKVEIEPLFTDYVDFETFSKSDFRAVKIKECFAVPKSKKLLQFTVNDGSGVDRTILSGIHEW